MNKLGALLLLLLATIALFKVFDWAQAMAIVFYAAVSGGWWKE